MSNRKISKISRFFNYPKYRIKTESDFLIVERKYNLGDLWWPEKAFAIAKNTNIDQLERDAERWISNDKNMWDVKFRESDEIKQSRPGYRKVPPYKFYKDEE